MFKDVYNCEMSMRGTVTELYILDILDMSSRIFLIYISFYSSEIDYHEKISFSN